MDLAFTKEEQALRDEVRQFFKDNVPPDICRMMGEGRHHTKDEMVTWWRILNKKGWAVTHWPKEYGGTGWSSVQHYIFNEELQSYPAPQPLAFGVSMVGPVIYTFGSEEQKKRYLPRLAEDQGRAPRRQVDHQRPEDLDHAGPACRHDLLPVPHRPECEEADRHLLHPDRHEKFGFFGVFFLVFRW